MPRDDNPDDPLDLDGVDRDIRINELTERARELGLDDLQVGEDCTPEVHEGFLESVVDFESAPIGTRFDQLLAEGVELPPPDALDDAALHVKLWEIAQALAKLDVYLCHTDHLSDRELYEEMWNSLLREETTIMPPGWGWRNHIDVLGGCSEEDIQIGLRYYDSEEQRQRWAEDFPQDPIPPHEDPPYDRDRHLPKCDPPP